MRTPGTASLPVMSDSATTDSLLAQSATGPSATDRLRTNADRVVAGVLVSLLLLGCVLVLRPFISDLAWAVIVCFSTWPMYRRLTAIVGQRRTLAAVLMGVGLVLTLLLPLVIVGSTVADDVKNMAAAARKLLEQGPPAPPAWLAKVPLIGNTAVEYWQNLAADSKNLWALARRIVEPVSTWLLKLGLLAGSGLLQMAMSTLIAVFLFRDGAALAGRLNAAARRIGGTRAEHLLGVAGSTIRSVVYGILGTALVQAILAGIGFLIAGVPGAGVLALLTFFVSVLPLMGTAIVWLPVALWLLFQGATGWAIFMVVWGLGVNNIEHLIKPFLISKGSDLPFLLIFFGVLGGAFAFGFIGVFLGPTILAVGYRVVSEWTATQPQAAAAETRSSMTSATSGIPKGNAGYSDI